MAGFEQAEVKDLRVETRQDQGKEAMRKLRQRGRMPGIFYGLRAAPVKVSVVPADLMNALDTSKRINTLIRLVSEDPEVNGKLVLVKELQRHPLNRSLLHVDLMEAYPDRPVKVWVAIHVKGHAKGVDLGGTLEQHLRHVEIKCPADKIPAALELDVSDLGMGQGIKIHQLPVGEGIQLLGDPQATVVSVVAPKLAVEEAAPVEAAEGAEAAGGEGAVTVEGEAKKEDKVKEKPAKAKE